MSIQAALFYYLVRHAEVAPLVSSRIYPAGDAPRKPTMPYITYQKIDNVHERHQTGSSELAHPRIQINCWDATPQGARTLYEAVRVALDRYRGDMGDPLGIITVKGAYLQTDRDEFTVPTDASQRGPHCEIMDFIIWHEE